MNRTAADCLLCRRDDADREFGRTEVWRDELWRLTVMRHGPIPGFAHMEPLRHVPHITDLAGPEAASFGPVLAKITAALQAVTGADLVYANIFGERVAHLHVNLAPHHEGDALLGGPGMLRADTPDAPPDRHERAVAGVRDLLAPAPPSSA